MSRIESGRRSEPYRGAGRGTGKQRGSCARMPQGRPAGGLHTPTWVVDGWSQVFDIPPVGVGRAAGW